MKGLLFDNWGQKVAALAIAFLLWQVVTRIEAQQERKTIPGVPIEYINAPERLQRTFGRTTVDVLVTTFGSTGAIDGSQVRAFVDLANAKPGTKVYPVDLDPPPSWRSYVRLESDPKTVRVTLEQFDSRRLKVEVELTGTRADGYRVGNSSLDPAEVEIRGPLSRVQRADIARVSVERKSINQGEPQQLLVEVLDAGRSPLNLLQVEPNKVTFRANLIPLPPQKNVLIQPTWQGAPSVGYRLERYVITPANVRITGRADLLEPIFTLDTQAIDISGLSADSIFTVPLKIPAGVTSEVNQVQVRIYVRKDAAP